MQVNLFGRKVRSFYTFRNYWRRNGGRIKGLMIMNLFIWGIAFFVFQAVKTEFVLAQEPQVIREFIKQDFENMPNEVKETLDYYADLYGVSKSLVHKIVSCESNYSTDRNKLGDLDKQYVANGMWQFQNRTFYEYAEKYKVRNADVKDWKHQTLVAVQMLRDGKQNLWTCAH